MIEPTSSSKSFRQEAAAWRWFAIGFVTALLAALGAWPTPGLLRDSETKRQDQKRRSAITCKAPRHE